MAPEPLVATDNTMTLDKQDTLFTSVASRTDFFTDTLLQNLIDSALANNFDLLNAGQQVRIGEVVAFVNSALNKPTLSASLGAKATRFGFYTMEGVGNFDMNKSPNLTPEMQVPNIVPDFFIGVQSAWEADVWGRLKNLRNSAVENMLATQLERQWLVTQLVAQVATLYYEWSALVYEIEVINRNIVLQESALDIVKALKLGGRATQLAVQQFEAQVDRTRALQFQLARQLAETEGEINFLCGRYPAQLPVGTPIMQQMLPQIALMGVPSELLRQRPDVSAALHRLSAAYQQTEAARKAFLPAFHISAFLGFQGFHLPAFFNAQSITAGLAGNALAPIFQRRQIRGQYAISEAEHQMSWIEYRKRVRLASMEVYNNLKSIEALHQQFLWKERELKTLRDAISTANDLYTNGYANYLEVITAQQTLLEADLELVQVRKTQLQYAIQLYRALGGGWQ
jgi:NodT family efflux transporter outer membrane factor (OMF) lipoprotein